ncbi:MAG TPA: transglycosylase SLT domain-containing protein [Ktedonobacterales bacterium]|nr:transglycosylase SLT domain-containing protein [Ktedonobacterales bacterium]
MRYHTAPPPAPTSEKEARRPFSLLWTACLIVVILACLTCGAAGIFVWRNLPSLLPPILIDTPLPVTPEPTYQPTTPPLFGLTGQATCRNTKPPTTSPWLPVAITDAQKYQIDILAFIWQIWQESQYNPNAVSSAQAIGIAQFLPETAASLGIDPHDPAASLNAAARLDRERLDQFSARAQQLSAHYGGASVHYAFGLALAAYDAGIGAVNDAWSQSLSNGWPPDPWDWLARMHQEPRQYVPAILGCL